MHSRRFVLYALLLSIGLLSGCDGVKSGTIVKGRLLNNGAAFAPPMPANLPPGPQPPPGVKNTGADYHLIYRPVIMFNGPGGSFSSPIAADGTFTLNGEGKGIPSGQYTVSVSAKPPAIDPFGGKLSGGSKFQVMVPNQAEVDLPVEVGGFVVPVDTTTVVPGAPPSGS